MCPEDGVRNEPDKSSLRLTMATLYRATSAPTRSLCRLSGRVRTTCSVGAKGWESGGRASLRLPVRARLSAVRARRAPPTWQAVRAYDCARARAYDPNICPARLAKRDYWQ